MRQVILDTETTGLDPLVGHRVVEVACLELFNHLPTGRSFQSYINPERDMPEDAARIHGLTTDFLAQHPTFDKIADDLILFLQDSQLVIHNADFDLNFLNAEFTRVKKPLLPKDRALDTVMLARRKFPGAPASLDALCKRFSIDNSARTLHGALLDCQLLAEVYLELMGGRQPGLIVTEVKKSGATPQQVQARASNLRAPRAHAPSAEELAAHEKMLEKLTDPLWRA